LYQRCQISVINSSLDTDKRLVAIVDANDGKSRAPPESVKSNLFQSARQTDSRQLGATQKSIPSDFGDSLWDDIGSCISARALKKNSLILVKQNPIHAAEKAIAGIYIYSAKIAAIIKCASIDAINPGRNGNALDPITPIESMETDTHHACGKLYIRNRGATRKRPIHDVGCSILDLNQAARCSRAYHD
jgi:hypothetical protein